MPFNSFRLWADEVITLDETSHHKPLTHSGLAVQRKVTLQARPDSLDVDS